jgi:hypothetical protein
MLTPLKLNSAGPEVAKLQRSLAAAGFDPHGISE